MIRLEIDIERTPEETAKIKKLRQLIEGGNYLNSLKKCVSLEIGTEEILLTKFLYFSGWDVNSAFEAIHKYYDFKSCYPDWVAQKPVEYFRDHFHSTQSKFVLPKPDKSGRAIIVFKSVDAFDRYPNYAKDMVEMDDLIFEGLLMLPRVQKYGISVIVDLKGATKKFLCMLSPAFLKIVNLKHDVLPFTNRTMHIIQRGFVMNATTSLLSPFMGKDFKEKMIIHDGKNFNKLRDMIGYENLPGEYGGPPENELDVNLIFDYLMENSDYLDQLQNYRKNVITSDIIPEQ